MREVVYDRQGHAIYLTDERWDHVQEFHNEMTGYKNELLTTLKRGRRKQDVFDASIYTYVCPFPHLPDDHTHIIVIVKFGRHSIAGEELDNNFVLTAYQKTIYSQRQKQ